MTAHASHKLMAEYWGFWSVRCCWRLLGWSWKQAVRTPVAAPQGLCVHMEDCVNWMQLVILSSYLMFVFQVFCIAMRLLYGLSVNCFNLVVPKSIQGPTLSLCLTWAPCTWGLLKLLLTQRSHQRSSRKHCETSMVKIRFSVPKACWGYHFPSIYTLPGWDTLANLIFVELSQY